jgi:Zn-dependent protease with chaperone function
MIPIPPLGGQLAGQTLLTLVLTLAPALIAWWHDRRLLDKANDPALPELLANRRRLNVRTIAFCAVLMIVFGGANAAWGIPLLVVLLIGVAYPVRTRVLGETWGCGAYLWHTAASIIGGFGFWIALCYAPSVVRWMTDVAGAGRPWLAVGLAAVVAALLLVWEARYPRFWLRTHAAERLETAELTPRFQEIVRRAGTIAPAVYRVGPQGSRFVNAVALPSVREPSVAMGNALLDLLAPDEAAAIFAHEVAHFDHFTPRYVRRSQLINRLLIVTGVTLPLLAAFAQVTWAGWIGWVWPFIVLGALGRRAAKSQQHETESDLRAAALCGDPEALVRGLVKLHLHARIPRRYDVDIERASSHPSLVRRIQAIRAGGAAAVEQLGAATVIPSTRPGSWVVLEDTRSYWLDGVPEGTEPQLAALREASSSYRAVNYQDLVELRVSAAGDARTITARTRAGDRWSVPIASDDVARVQRALDVVDLRLGKAGPAPARVAPRAIALAAFAVTFLAGQTGVGLVPILLAIWKPNAAVLAALGAMSIVRAVLGALEGATWLDPDLARVGLAALGVVGVFAIYTAWRLVRAGAAAANLRLAMAVLVGLAVVTGAAVVVQAAKMPATPLVGAPMVGTFATVLFGVAAALFTVQTRWSRPAGYTGLALASLVAFLGVDRRALALRHALAEASARATPESETQLGGQAYSLRVSPGGHHFLAAQTPTYRPGSRPRSVLVTGRVGGRARELAAVDAEFVDDARLLTVAVVERGVELRLENADSSGILWADTLADAPMLDPRLMIDRDHGSWVIVGTDGDNDRTVVLTGRIGEKGGTLRAAISDTIGITGEPIVFDEGATLVFPSYRNTVRAAGQRMPPLSLWAIPLFGVDLPAMDLVWVHGDSVRSLISVRGTPQCGEPLGGQAACVVHRLNATSFYTVGETGDIEEVAQLSINEFRVAAVGPGLHAASAMFDRGIVVVDLAAKRLTRIALPPNGQFATEARAGPGWAVTLGYGQNQRSVVRSYRIQLSQHR